MFIEIDDLLSKDNVNIIDIRSHDKYIKGHIMNAINISEFELINNPNLYLKRDEIYFIYCDFGNRSRSVCSLLNALGFSTVSVIGGYNNYLFRA